MIHTVKDFGIVNKAEIDVFLELSCFFDDPVDVVNLISGSLIFKLKFYLFLLYLFIYLFGCTRSYLQHVGSSIFIAAYGVFAFLIYLQLPGSF